MKRIRTVTLTQEEYQNLLYKIEELIEENKRLKNNAEACECWWKSD